MEFNLDNIDKNIYVRERDTKRLVHRNKAYKEIYLKNREKYPLPFSLYVVHHIDGNKLNNTLKNLLILTQEEHRKIHGFKFNKLMQKEVDKIIENLKKLNKKEINQVFSNLK